MTDGVNIGAGAAPWKAAWAACIRLAGVAALLFALTWLQHLLPREPGQFTPVGVVGGVFLIILLFMPRPQWLGVAIAAFVGQASATLLTHAPPVPGLAISAVAVAEGVGAAALSLRFVGMNAEFGDVRTAIKYLLIVAAAAVVGGVAVGLIASSAGRPVVHTAIIWGTRDFAGMATLTPCLFGLVRYGDRWRQLVSWNSWPLAVLLAVEVAVFLTNHQPLTYLVIAGLMLVTWRLGILGAIVAMLMTIALSIVGTFNNLGPFAVIPGTITERLLSLQLFLTIAFHLTVPVAAQAVRSRRLAEALGAALETATESESRYRLIADGMADIVLRVDLEGRLLYVSPSCRFVGYEPEELIGRLGSEFVHPDEIPRLEINTAQVLSGQPDDLRDRRYRLRLKDGGYRWFEGSPRRMTDDDGNVIGVINILRDITEQRAAADALEASEARYRLATGNMSDIVACYGRDAVITFISGGTLATLGYEPEEMVGRRIAELLHPDEHGTTRARFDSILEAGPSAGDFRHEYRMRRKEGGYVWLESHPRAIYDAAGDFVEWQDVIRDVTGRRALENDLRAAQAEADAIAQAKAAFLADMSHELRGPLNAVAGFARLTLKQAGLGATARTYIQRIEDASRGLISMVDQILDFSRIEAAQVEYRERPTDIAAFAQMTLDFVEPQARAKNLDLTLSDTTPHGLTLMLDDGRLRQVVLNLLGNALKFTQSGGITLAIGYQRSPPRLTVEVRDTGPGIPRNRLGMLFKRYSQVDDSGQRAYGGAGLGLAISKGIVEGMGGSIGVSSKVGAGSRFWFWIPAVAADPGDQADDEARGQPRLRILLQAADPAVLEQAAADLAPLGAEVLGARSMGDAAQIATREPLDLMIIEMDGSPLEAAAALARLRGGRRNAVAPVLALLDHPGDADLPAAPADFQGVIGRPFSRPELISAVAHALAQSVFLPGSAALPRRRSERRTTTQAKARQPAA